MAETLLFLILLVQPTGVEQMAAQYWEAMGQRNKVAAMQFVHPDDLNTFLYRTEGAFRNWKIDSIELIDSGHANVNVSLEIQFQDQWLDHSFADRWELVGGSWKIRIEAPEEAIFNRYEADAQQSLPPELTVTPKTLRHYRISAHRPAVLTINNGLQSAATVSLITLDGALFEAPPTPITVAPGTKTMLQIRYKGSSQDLNQQSTITVSITQDDQLVNFEIPITYNYSDGLTRWLEKQRVAPQPQHPQKQ